MSDLYWHNIWKNCPRFLCSIWRLWATLNHFLASEDSILSRYLNVSTFSRTWYQYHNFVPLGNRVEGRLENGDFYLSPLSNCGAEVSFLHHLLRYQNVALLALRLVARDLFDYHNGVLQVPVHKIQPGVDADGCSPWTYPNQ